jgi:hypothetical protein
MQEKLDDACNQATNYYIAQVHQDQSEDVFNKKIRAETSEEFEMSTNAFKKAYNVIFQASNTTKAEFDKAYENSGFLTQPQNCFNKILMQLKVEEEKSKVEYESLIFRLNLLFGYYRDQVRRRMERGKAKSGDKLTDKTTEQANKTQKPKKTTEQAKKTTKKLAGPPKSATTTTSKTTSQKSSSPTKASLASTISTSTKTLNQTQTSKVNDNLIEPGNPLDSATPQQKCPKMPNILPYLDEMKEKSIDLIKQARFYYVDHVNRRSDFVSFQVGLRERVFYSQKSFNASYNLAYGFMQQAVNVTKLDYTQAVRANGFLSYPLSCYNKLIFTMKSEYYKLLGRNEASLNQVKQLFLDYRVKI